MRYLIILFVFTLAAPAISKTITVPGDYQKIQDAIDNAMAGDLILVDPGTYIENIDYKAKAITIRSVQGPKTTIIDGNRNGSVVTLDSYVPVEAELDGFTITNGEAKEGGGIYTNSLLKITNNIITKNTLEPTTESVSGAGIFCTGPTVIENNVISYNHPDTVNDICWGGGIYCAVGAKILNNEIYENSAGIGVGAGIFAHYNALIAGNIISMNIGCYRGGGIYLYSTNSVVTDNIIFGNMAELSGGGIASGYGLNCSVKNCLIYDNNARKGGGVYAMHILRLTNCTIYNNHATYFLGGGGLFVQNGNECVVENCIFRENDAPVNEQIWGNPKIVSHSNIEDGFAGPGNIDADPMFVNESKFDFRLKQDPYEPGVNNPCVDSGNNIPLNLGLDKGWTNTGGVPDSGIVDMGFHYGPISPHMFTADKYEISAGSGGEASLTLNCGFDHKIREYLILGSASGYSPGTWLPGGKLKLPLNLDAASLLLLGIINSSICQNFKGSLDIDGDGEAKFSIGPVPAAAGLSLSFAYILRYPLDFVSNPVRIDIIP